MLQMHGKGIMIYKKKNCSYRGEFTHGERTGRGYWLDANGHQWMGTWYRGRLFGSGVFISKVTEQSVDVSEVNRLADVLTPAVEGKNESAPDRPEDSDHHEQRLDAVDAAKKAAARKAKGDTTFDVQVGEKYVGQFNNSQRRGKGEATYANGDVYKVGAIRVVCCLFLFMFSWLFYGPELVIRI